jgi:hypothetical protein
MDISYTFVDRCQGGAHARIDVSVNGGPVQRIVYATDDIREPLSELSREQIDIIKLIVLKAHFQGKTRAQILAEFANPVTITI